MERAVKDVEAELVGELSAAILERERGLPSSTPQEVCVNKSLSRWI